MTARRRNGPFVAANVGSWRGASEVAETDCRRPLKNRDKILEAIGRLKGRYPKGTPFVNVTVDNQPTSLTIEWNVVKVQGGLSGGRRLSAAKQSRRLDGGTNSGKPTSNSTVVNAPSAC